MAGKHHRSKLHAHYRPRNNIRYPSQCNSTLLNLPGEIRMLIYQACLVRPTPIDLWPPIMITDPTSLPELVPRIKKAEDAQSHLRLNQRYATRFRHQADLEFMRKNMVVALLRTCRQVFNEAAHLFWGANVWRFSCDDKWIGLRRFLITAGPRARDMIKNIEALAPIENFHLRDVMKATDVPDGALERSKNHPKLRLVKQESGDNIEFVVELMKREPLAALKNFRFLLPKGWTMDKWAYLRNLPQQNWQIERSIWDEEGLDMYLHFGRFQKEVPWLTYFLVVEEGAEFLGPNYAEILNEEGITVLLEKDAKMTIHANGEGTAITEVAVDQTKIFEAKVPTYDYLAGIKSMFEPEQIASPGLGGKVTKSTPRSTARVLKGFGGCRFVHRYGYYCQNCGAKAPDQKMDQYCKDRPAWPKKGRKCSMAPANAPPGSRTYLVDGIPHWQVCQWWFLDCVAVANTKRAERFGVVEQEITGRRWMF